MEASFTSAGVLIPSGAYCLWAARKKSPRYWPFALIPIIFGIQQITEGFVWWGLEHDDANLARRAGVVYLFFAVAFWPTWISLSATSIETQWGRSRVLRLWTIASTAWFWWLYFPLLIDLSTNSGVGIVHHSIRYQYMDEGWPNPAYRTAVRILYFVTAATPLLITSERRWFRIPVLLGVISILLSFWIFEQTFTSVWCFFAAVLSVGLVVIFAMMPQPSHDQALPPDHAMLTKSPS